MFTASFTLRDFSPKVIAFKTCGVAELQMLWLAYWMLTAYKLIKSFYLLLNNSVYCINIEQFV